MSPRAVLAPAIGDVVAFDRVRWVIREIRTEYSGPKAICSSDDAEGLSAQFHVPDMRWDQRRNVWRLA